MATYLVLSFHVLCLSWWSFRRQVARLISPQSAIESTMVLWKGRYNYFPRKLTYRLSEDDFSFWKWSSIFSEILGSEAGVGDPSSSYSFLCAALHSTSGTTLRRGRLVHLVLGRSWSQRSRFQWRWEGCVHPRKLRAGYRKMMGLGKGGLL